MPSAVLPPRQCDRCGARLARHNRSTRCAPCRSRELREPPAVPREFWDAPEMRAALAAWHMGRVINAYRHHPWHGQVLRQSVVGNWFGLTQTQLSRIETGHAPEEMSKLVRWAKLLGIPPELLWFKVPGDGGADPVLAAPITLPVIVDGRTAPVLAPDAAELERLAAALADARRYLDGSAAGLFRAQLERCKADDGNHGAGRALPLVLGILDALSGHVREVKPGVRGQLLSLAAEGAEFAGWLYRDLKDHRNAAYWYDRAMEWAQEANDRSMQGYVLLRKSQMAYEIRDAHRVFTFAAAAQEGPWALPPLVRAEVCQQEARGLAMLGEPVTAVERKLDQARSLFASASLSDHPRFAVAFTENALQLRNASCYIEAGKPGQAADLFGRVLDGGELSRRDAGYYRARRAFAYALSGAPDDAAREGLLALDVAAATRSRRTTAELSRTVKALEPWSSRPGPRQLSEALRAIR